MLLYFFGLGLLVTQAFASNNPPFEQASNSYENATYNAPWKTLFKKCKDPSVKCVDKNIYKFLNQVLEFPRDYSVTNFLKFVKNSVNYTQIENGYEDSKSESEESTGKSFDGTESVNELSRTINKKGVEFFMTHDLEVVMPETYFEGATLKIAPTELDENGALLRVDFLPRSMSEDNGEGRIFFKKFKKKIGQKLVHALIAILIIIKLVAVKLLFFLPTLLGVAAAKKVILKIVFFLFPFVKHIFKLCPLVPHGTKYHHHKHQIAHIHHVGGHHPHEGVEVLHPHASGPPHGGASLHHFVDIEQYHPPSYRPHEQEAEYYSGGPEAGDQIINRRDPNVQENEISGQGHGRPTKKNSKKPLTTTELEKMILKAEREAMIRARLEIEKKRIQEDNARLQEELRQAMKLQERLKLEQINALSKTTQLLKNSVPTMPSPYLQSPSSNQRDHFLPVSSLFDVSNQPSPSRVVKYTGGHDDRITSSIRTGSDQGTSMVSRQGAAAPSQGKYISPEHVAVNSTTATRQPAPPKYVNKMENYFQKALQQAASITFDPFYSPILQKIDKILNNLGYADEPCKERLICFMYKSPEKYSPHSNLVSNELSRDPDELPKSKGANAAVVRYYKYVQAARDGQAKKNCIILYPGCNVLGSEL
ncbi:hypothetical protein HHI36_006990 [Cryptolaemus montrouzieri]|uniref:Uncharacterized protein n=1 Tax=Cryptolaemus montrouzieri TaxID=559131 RepID=A0ABD2MN76_9CUCU